MKLRKELNYLNGLFCQQGVKSNALIRGGISMLTHKTVFLVAVAVLAFSFVSAGNATGSIGLDERLVELKKIAIDKLAKARKCLTEAKRCQTVGRHFLEATRRAEKDYVSLKNSILETYRMNKTHRINEHLQHFDEQARKDPKVRRWVATHSRREWEEYKRREAQRRWLNEDRERIITELEGDLKELKKRKIAWENCKFGLKTYIEEFNEAKGIYLDAKGIYLDAKQKYLDHKGALINEYNTAKNAYMLKKNNLHRYMLTHHGSNRTYFVRKNVKELAALKQQVNDAAERCGQRKVI